MNYHYFYYKDITQNEWDAYVARMQDAGFYHSWSWINYISKFPGVIENLSFICLDDEKSLLAVCPLAVSYNTGDGYHEISFGGNPCGTPLISNIKPGFRRKISDEVFHTIFSFAKRSQAKKINLIWDPVVKGLFTPPYFHTNSFELLRYQMHYYIENVMVVSLDLSEDILFENVSKYQRRHIKKTEQKGVAVTVFNRNNNISEIEKHFNLFQEAHCKSAGRMTRPQETWDAMFDCLSVDSASLFIASIENIPISFLFCGEFDSMAFGWSQVNVDEYETKYSPRHFLEWTTMMFYKRRGFKYYEIGDRFYGSQLFHLPTEKEISISVFKERFGGMLLPKIRWTGYFDSELLTEDYRKGLENFLMATPILKESEN